MGRRSANSSQPPERNPLVRVNVALPKAAWAAIKLESKRTGKSIHGLMVQACLDAYGTANPDLLLNSPEPKKPSRAAVQPVQEFSYSFVVDVNPTGQNSPVNSKANSEKSHGKDTELADAFRKAFKIR